MVPYLTIAGSAGVSLKLKNLVVGYGASAALDELGPSPLRRTVAVHPPVPPPARLRRLGARSPFQNASWQRLRQKRDEVCRHSTYCNLLGSTPRFPTSNLVRKGNMVGILPSRLELEVTISQRKFSHGSHLKLEPAEANACRSENRQVSKFRPMSSNP